MQLIIDQNRELRANAATESRAKHCETVAWSDSMEEREHLHVLLLRAARMIRRVQDAASGLKSHTPLFFAYQRRRLTSL